MSACRNFYEDFARRALLLASDRERYEQRQRWWTEFFEELRDVHGLAMFHQLCSSCQTPYEEWLCSTEAEGDCLRWCARDGCAPPANLSLCPACGFAACSGHTTHCSACARDVCDTCMEHECINGEHL